MIAIPDRSNLSKDMVRIADEHRLPADHELRTLANAFDKATAGHFATPQTVSVREFVGAWARARKALSTFTGQPLI